MTSSRTSGSLRSDLDTSKYFSSEITPRSFPITSASMAITATWPVKALVEATPISGPTWMYVPESVALEIDEPTTLQIP